MELYAEFSALAILEHKTQAKKGAPERPKISNEKWFTLIYLKTNWLGTDYTQDHSDTQSPPCVGLIAGDQN